MERTFMATTSTPEESAHLILRTFVTKRNNPEAGAMLLRTSFLMTFLAKGLCEDDFGTGLKYAIEKGWVKMKMPSVQITLSGIEEASAETSSLKQLASDIKDVLGKERSQFS
jgi:hypothetical protein